MKLWEEPRSHPQKELFIRDIAKEHSQEREREDSLLAKSYGDVFTLWIGHYPVVVLAGFETVKEGLTDNYERLSGRPMIPFFKFLSNEKGQPLDPLWPLMRSASKVISTAAFGHHVPTEEEALRNLTEHVNTVTKFRGSAGEMVYNIFPSLMQHIPGPHKKVISSCEFIRSFIKKEEQMDSTTTFNEDNLVQVIADLFVAGTDTLAATLSWALLLMATHPDIQEKVQKELQSALDPSKPIGYEDRKKLHYTNAVIHEIQRFSNIVLFGLPRLCMEDFNIFGHFIPKRWETPQQFSPNHFLDKDGKYTAREEFFAFGTGCRSCLGRQLAQTELFIFFTCLMKAFTFCWPEGLEDTAVQPVVGPVVHPGPFKICAVPR
ncbi:hypothetical protein JD844_007987 [Phrynosoma platyrhinos]|uniref:Uncharacterized protein n=1 Tax=Phrynosoma platyrhinos TaxID=52577 RepID=A0ABQ7T4A1_PHRPL|nr:hypothetical protein JD844_007987 [Phrynosoma platyrhinos]